MLMLESSSMATEAASRLDSIRISAEASKQASSLRLHSKALISYSCLPFYYLVTSFGR